MLRWLLNGVGKGFGWLVFGRKVGKWAALLLLAGAAQAEVRPSLPTLTLGGAAAVATSAVSVSVFADHQLEMNLALTTSQFFSHGPIREWSISVGATGSATGFWTVDLELSNDGATWTKILTHGKADKTGTMVFGPHKTARQVRLNLSSIGAGMYVTATAFGSP